MTSSAEGDRASLPYPTGFGAPAVLPNLPYARDGVSKLMASARAPSATEETLQRWTAVRKMNYNGHAGSLVAKYTPKIRKPQGSPWYTEDVLAQLTKRFKAADEKNHAQTQARSLIPRPGKQPEAPTTPATPAAQTATTTSTPTPTAPKKAVAGPSQQATTLISQLSLSKRTESLITDMADLEEELKKKNRELEELQAQFTKSRETQQAVEGVNARLREDYNSLDTRMNGFKDEVTTFQTTIEQQELTIRQREQEISNRDEQIRLLETSLNDQNHMIAELEGQVENKKEELKAERKSHSLTQDSNKREVRNLEGEIKKRAEENETLVHRLESEQAKFQEEKKNTKMSREYVEELKSKQQTLDIQLEARNHKIAELEHSGEQGRNALQANKQLIEERMESSIRIENLQAELQSANSELETISEQLKEKSDDEHDLRRENSTLSQRVDDLEQQRTQFEHDRSTLQTQISSLQKKLAESATTPNGTGTDEAISEGAGLFTPSSPPPAFKSADTFNSLADELERQSDEEEEEDEDEESVDSMEIIDYVDSDMQTDAEPPKAVEPLSISAIQTNGSITPVEIARPILSSKVSMGCSVAPVETTKPVLSSNVFTVSSITPVAAKPIDVAMPPRIDVASKDTNDSKQMKLLQWLALAMCFLWTLIAFSQAIEYHAFNSPKLSGPVRAIYTAISPILGTVHRIPGLEMVPLLTSDSYVGRAGTYGTGSWIGGVIPLGWSESVFDPGYLLGGVLIRLEQALGVDRASVF